MTSFEYQIGGSLRSDSPSYVYRQADHVFFASLRAGKFCYVLNSRQMGKSSLRVQAIRRLEAHGFACIFVDLTGMGRQGLTPEKWYAGFVQALVTGSSLGPWPWRAWWKEQREFLSPCQCLGSFIEEVLAPMVGKPLVIFVDEIDRVLSQSFSLDDFFGLIRSFSEKKAERPKQYPLTFALLGVASPTELVQDRTKSPFNIGTAIALSGFSIHEAQPLLAGLQTVVPNPEQVLQEILEWTNGQPFLTQKLCQLMVASARENGEHSVESVVRSRILERWESQDEPEHLRTIRDRIIRHRQTTVPCLEIYAHILSQGAIAADQSQIQQSLKLSGLVIESEGYLYPHNRIYQTIFNLEWAEQQLANIRPYSNSLAAWNAKGRPPDQDLLTGASLDEALAWAADKQLSDKDYQYFVASQQYVTQSTQTSLDITESANQMLRAAQVESQHLAARYRCPWSKLMLVAVGVTGLVMGVNRLGWIQGLELSLYDVGMRLNPTVPRDQRIVLVTIDEEDIQRFGQWPISDQTLAKTIQVLQSSGVHSIGLDFYRDLPVDPGHPELVQQFKQSSNIFAIERLMEQSIPGPPELPSQNVGFSGQVLDDDSRIRRALLAMDYQGHLSFSFATQMALNFLAQKDIQLVELDPEGKRVQLGQAIFNRLDEGDGAYQQVDTGGYQILLNWSKADFDRISLGQVLDAQVPAGGWRDRIVLIGVTSKGTKDFFYTPFSYRPFRTPQLMSGVSVHAQIVSLILGAALGERSLLQPCSQPVAWLWTFSGAVIGAMIPGRFSRRLVQISVSSLGIILLFGGFLLVFWGGIWLTGASSFVALIGAQVCVLSLKKLQQNRYQRQMLTHILQQHIHESPQAGQMALKIWEESQN